MFLFQENQDVVTQVITKRDGVIAGAVGFPIALFIIGIIVLFLIVVKRNRQKGVEQELRQMRNTIPAPQSQARNSRLQRHGRNRQDLGTNEMTSTSMILSNQTEHPDDFVPPYTATANENDLGYYDVEGKFHAIDYLKPPLLPPIAYTR